MPYVTMTDDPAADWDAYCEELDDEERQFIEAAPRCECCGRSVAEANGVDCYFLFGVYFCTDCIDKGRREIPVDY